jgi:hypothetical protein
MSSQYNARNLAALKSAWTAATAESVIFNNAATDYRSSVTRVADELVKLAVKMGINGAASTDVFLATVKTAMRNVTELTDGAFRKMWSRVTKSAYLAKGTPLVISKAVKDASAQARANILKGFAANYTFDKAAAQALIKKHMEDEAFLVNAGKLIEQLSGGKEVFRIAKVAKPEPEAKAKPAAKVVGKIAPVAKVTRTKKAA